MGACRLGWEGCRAQPGLPIPSPLQPPCPIPLEGFKGRLLKGAGDVISLYTPTTDKPQTPSPPGRRLEGRLPATGPSLPAHFTFYPGHGSEFRGREAASQREYQCSPAAQRTNSIFISIFLLLWVRCWGFFPFIAFLLLQFPRMVTFMALGRQDAFAQHPSGDIKAPRWHWSPFKEGSSQVWRRNRNGQGEDGATH